MRSTGIPTSATDLSSFMSILSRACEGQHNTKNDKKFIKILTSVDKLTIVRNRIYTQA